MHAEVISIGDELTSGQRLDTNSQWLSTRLGELGVRTLYHTTVADDLGANVEVFRAAAQRADIVVATGGLGPTADDLTREAIAAATGTELALDESALNFIANLFARRGRAMPERNRVQAFFPAGSRVIPNPAGTAPGIDIDVPRTGGPPSRVFALPGVPAEMRDMWASTVEPAIRAMVGPTRVIRHRRIKCFGVGESELEAMLPDLIRRGREPSVGITVHQATITLRITAAGSTPEECALAMEPTVAIIRESLGELVYGEEDDELQDAVLRLLAERGKTVATAEWGTGGLVAHWLSSSNHSNGAYRGSFVYSVDDAQFWRARMTEMDRLASADRSDSAAKQMALALAGGARTDCDADYGLAFGPVPGSSGEGSDEPANLWLAVASLDGSVAISVPFVGHPDVIKARAGKQALNLLRLRLLRNPGY